MAHVPQAVFVSGRRIGTALSLFTITLVVLVAVLLSPRIQHNTGIVVSEPSCPTPPAPPACNGTSGGGGGGGNDGGSSGGSTDMPAIPGYVKNDWTGWAGALNGWRASRDESKISPVTAPNLLTKWKLAAPTGVTLGDLSATPAVSGDSVYAADWNGNAFRINKDTGVVVWRLDLAKVIKDRRTSLGKPTTGLPNSLGSRTTPVIVGDLVILTTQQDALVVAANRNTGAVVWTQQLDDHMFAINTQTPAVYKNKIFIGTSSSEESAGAAYMPGYECCTFQGSMIALDLATGTQLWKTYTVEDGYRGKDKFPGVAVWGGAPAIDASDDSVYFATGNNYEAPPEVEQCETNRRACMANATAAALGCGFGGDCLPKDKVHYNAIIKVDIATGAIKWASTFADYEAWNLACFLGAYGPNPANCPVVAGPDYDFGQGPMLLRIPVKGQMTDAVGAGQKSGIFWMLRRDNGQVIWETQVAPGGALGGLEFGSATDGRTIYTASANFENKRHVLVDGSVTYAGSWAAIDAWTGRIKWQRAIPGAEKAKCGYCGTPQGSNCDAGTQCVVFTGDYTALQTTGHLRRGLGAVTYANGIMYASTYDDQGDLYALDANTGDILWSYKTGAGNICGPAVSNGTVYWGIGYSRLPGGVAGDKGLMALAPPSVTGTQQYSADIPSSGSSSTPGSVTNDYRP